MLIREEHAMKPRVFIGSSKERINIAHALGDNFNAAGTAEARVWSEGIMQLSKSTLDSLLSGLRKYDFAVFILGRMILHKYETAQWLLHETT